MIGEDADEYINELKDKFKQKYDQLRTENARAASTKAQAFLQNYFAPIEHKLRNNDYQSFSDFERDLNQFQLIFMEEGPDGPQKKELMLEFCIGSLSEASMFFLRTA